MSTPKYGIFWDPISIMIVLGGTLAATAVSFQINRIFNLFNIFIKRVLLGSKYNYSNVIKRLMQVAESHRGGQDLKSLAQKKDDPFLREALDLCADKIMLREDLMSTLEDRAENMKTLDMRDANKLKLVGKFPPAFGMMGTTLGMIVMLSNLNGKDAIKMIGPAMSTALLTTFYGVVLAYLLLVPVAENVKDSAEERYLKNKIIIEGINLILDKQNPIYVSEKLNSFLSPGDRHNWKKA